jgi:hypothetical protein
MLACRRGEAGEAIAVRYALLNAGVIAAYTMTTQLLGQLRPDAPCQSLIDASSYYTRLSAGPIYIPSSGPTQSISSAVDERRLRLGLEGK